MDTQTAINQYLEKLAEDGKSENTRRLYRGLLGHFAEQFPELPLETPVIDAYLKSKRETPAHRGHNYKALQAFYSYLEKSDGITSPVPSKGRVGRPIKVRQLKVPETWPPVRDETAEPGRPGISGAPKVTMRPVYTADAVEKYVAFKRAEGVSERTVEEYRHRLGPFAKAFPMVPTDPDVIAKFLGDLQVSSITKWDYRKHIISLYHWLERRELIDEITKKFPRVKVPRKVRRVLSADELTSLFDHADNYQERAILTLLIDSKIRATELCTLTRDKVYPDHIVVTGKTGERSVPINPVVYEMLTTLADDGYIFTCEGRRFRREHLRILLRRLMERAGLVGPKLGPHILRHSSSVQHIMHGGSELALKEELGHTTLRMTEKYGELAFPEVKETHGKVNVLGHLAPTMELRRAVCFGCNTEIKVFLKDVKATKCPNCGQVGKWYLPDSTTADFAEVKGKR